MKSKVKGCALGVDEGSLDCFSNVKVALARLQPESWCKKSVQRPSSFERFAFRF